MTLKRQVSSFWRALKWSFEARPKLSFTREGQLFSLTTVGLGIAATNSGNNLLYLILGMMLSLILSSGVLSSLNLHRLRVKRRVPRFVTAGVPFEVTLILQNVKRAWPSMGVKVNEPLWRRDGWSEHRLSEGGSGGLREIFCFKINPEDEEQINYESLCPQRGLYSVAGARVITSFPFGLFQKSIGLSARATVKVYPRLDRAPLELTQRGELNDEERSSPHSLGMSAARGQLGSQSRDELSGLRLLGASEPLKLIHWRASAKRGELIRVQYHSLEPAQTTLWVSPYYAPGRSTPTPWEEDEWANLVASASYMLSRRGPLRVLFPNQLPWILNGHSQLNALLEWLIDAPLSLSEQRLCPPRDALVISHPHGVELIDGTPRALFLSPLAVAEGGEGE